MVGNTEPVPVVRGLRMRVKNRGCGGIMSLILHPMKEKKSIQWVRSWYMYGIDLSF